MGLLQSCESGCCQSSDSNIQNGRRRPDTMSSGSSRDSQFMSMQSITNIQVESAPNHGEAEHEEPEPSMPSARPSMHITGSRSMADLLAQSPSLKEEHKKKKYGNTATQISILCSAKARKQSLELCTESHTIVKHGKEKAFTFLHFLPSILTDHRIGVLFERVPKKSNEKEQSLGNSQFIKILILITILYKVQLFQRQTKTKDKPDLDKNEIQECVEHLSIWIIRNHGKKLHPKTPVNVRDDNGKQIKGLFHGYKLVVTKTMFKQSLTRWVREYVHKDGKYIL